MKSFHWLEGRWEMPGKEYNITEEWKISSDTSLSGRSDKQTAGKQTPLETMTLIYKNGKYFYIPVTANQNETNPVNFEIRTINDTQFIAENEMHDFPKRIVYKKITNDSIHAFIDGGTSGDSMRIDFFYKRKN